MNAIHIGPTEGWQGGDCDKEAETTVDTFPHSPSGFHMRNALNKGFAYVANPLTHKAEVAKAHVSGVLKSLVYCRAFATRHAAECHDYARIDEPCEGGMV